ncbi:MAG: S1 family peptidase [Gammaproteobacteria bacterium]
MIAFGFQYLGPAIALELPDLIAQAKPSVVGVGNYVPLRAPRHMLLGTGFVIGDGNLIVTNYHVVAPRPNDTEKSELVIFVGRGKQPEVRQVQMVAEDRTHDLALLRADGAPLPALALAEDGIVREGQAIAMIGYPIGAILGLYPSTNAGIVSSISPVALPQLSTMSLTASQIRRLREPFEIYQLDAIAYPGNSGSPVFERAGGHVIGIVTSVLARESKEGLLKDPSAITYAIPIKHVRELVP